MLDTKEKNEDDNYIEITESIQTKVEDICAKLKNVTFKDGDIRYDFIAGQLSTTRDFYRGYFLLVFDEYQELGKIKFEISLNEELSKMPSLFNNVDGKNGYINNLHRRYFLDTFSNLENCISIFLDNIIDEETHNNLLKARTKEIIQKLKIKELPIKEEISEILSRKLDTKHITQITFDAKMNYLFNKLANKFDKNLVTEIKQFLKFIQTFRNTHHNNFMFYGTKKYEYYFNTTHCLFEPNKLFVYKLQNQSNIEFSLNLVTQIENIWICITENIEFKGEICSIKNRITVKPSIEN